MALIKVCGLGLAQRLEAIDLSLRAGEVLGIIGPNGSGKSTLLQCLAGLLPYRGSCTLTGHELATLQPRQRAQAIGFLPQSCDASWPLAVEDIVALGRLPWGDADTARIDAAIEQAGVRALCGRRIDQLSGGEQARVWLARVLAGRPRVLLADEPIASLDLYYQHTIMDTLRRYADAGNAVVLAIHDFSLAARHCDRLCLLHEGRLHAFGTPAEVLRESELSTVFRIPVHVDLAARPPIIAVK